MWGGNYGIWFKTQRALNPLHAQVTHVLLWEVLFTFSAEKEIPRILRLVPVIGKCRKVLHFELKPCQIEWVHVLLVLSCLVISPHELDTQFMCPKMCSIVHHFSFYLMTRWTLETCFALTQATCLGTLCHYMQGMTPLVGSKRHPRRAGIILWPSKCFFKFCIFFIKLFFAFFS